ncbi:MAG: hypothetical protein RMX96_34900 [Nostoc sp. ChiSLP02]|nr:hypothetical protein [Nostoc sp. DedSLP05]MDZ8101559.1 hypothetical protein [Nostoc sp. DedSLP01]MDZ8190012.1 hypothetical protein [Nostoc sp. ChiSLP02]
MSKQIKDYIAKTNSIGNDLFLLQDASDNAYKKITGTNLANFITATVVTNKYIQLLDLKSDNSHGGSATAGSWLSRDLNTIANDDTGSVVLSNNLFVLPAGTYIANIQIPFEVTGRTRCRLRNTTDGTDILYSSSEYFQTGNGSSGHCFIKGKFTIASNKSLQVQYRCNTSQASFGLGNATGFGSPNEIFTIVELSKIS